MSASRLSFKEVRDRLLRFAHRRSNQGLGFASATNLTAALLERRDRASGGLALLRSSAIREPPHLSEDVDELECAIDGNSKRSNAGLRKSPDSMVAYEDP